ncbi:MAG: hypothetical protein IPK10_02335 [Bacteroidetes bacterium]|nr:hypothetical protein [Bacteroidota bacterium]
MLIITTVNTWRPSPHLGGIEDLTQIIDADKIEEVIIAIESSEHEFIGRIINELEDKDVIIKIIPDMYDILAGTVKMTSIFGSPHYHQSLLDAGFGNNL